MAKIARRSVASNPSSLTSSHSTIPSLNSIEQQHIKRSSVTKVESTTLPLLSTLNQSIDSNVTNHTASRTNDHIINNNLPTIHSTSSDSSNFSTKVNTNNSATKPKISASPATTATIHRDSGGIEQFNRTASTSIDPIASERERMRMEFYATYDVMTGVRIAATLGGFFGLMIFLIVYKSRNHSNETLKVLKDPKTAALAVACMQEEEDRKIIEAMDATGLSIFPDEYDNMLFRRQRMLSLGNVSAPPVLHRGYRFSSVGGGGYSSLLEPPRRSSYSYGGPGSRRKSASESSRILSNYPMGSSFGTDDYFIETDDELDNDFNQLNVNDDAQNQGYLEVPPTGQDTRRSSAMTCCSTESSYLERRCSALTLGLNNLPPSLRQKLESAGKNGQKRSHHGSSSDLWDYYYPDIQIIQATPKTSPCPSERERGIDKPKYTTTRTSSPQDTTTTAGSGVSSITIDSAGSSSYYYRKNSMSAYYDPESLQDKRLASFGNSAEGNSYYQQYELPPTENTEKTWRRQTQKNKYDDNNELKLIVKRKLSDASSCATTNINNNSLSCILNNNSSFTEAQAAAIAVIDGTVMAHMQRAAAGNGICGSGVGRAPLASCSSFKISSIDYQDSDFRSMGEDDSIFIESYADTDDDLEQFSTDSDEISLDIDDEDNINKQSVPPSAVSPHIKNELEKLALPVLGSSSTAQQTSIKSEPISIETVVKGRNFPSLERHRTLSVSSSDKIQLDSSTYRSSRGGKSSTLETHFTCPPISQQELLLKPNLSASNTPLLALRRAQLHQQYSDPQSLPTTTDEATTNTLETCSTEVPVVINPHEIALISKIPVTKATTHIVGGVIRKQQEKEPPAIKKTSSFSYDNNNDSSMSSSYSNSNNTLNKKRFSTSKLKNYRSHHSEGSRIGFVTGENGQNRGRTGEGGIGSSFSSSSINSSPIKNKENVGYNVMIDNKSKYKNIVKTTKRSTTNKGPSVILELPIINLPTGSSRYHDNNDDNSEKDNRSRGICSEGAVRDPSLPGTSRKWSKETLF